MLLLLICLVFAGLRSVQFLRTYPTHTRLASGQRIFETRWVGTMANIAVPLKSDDQDHPDKSIDHENARQFGNTPVSCADCHGQRVLGTAGHAETNLIAYQVLPQQPMPPVNEGTVHYLASVSSFFAEFAEVKKSFQNRAARGAISHQRRLSFDNFCSIELFELNPPPLFGLGQIDQIADWAILSNGVKRTVPTILKNLRGKYQEQRIGRIRGAPGSRVGKFGCKGQSASLKDYLKTACAVEIGLFKILQLEDIPKMHRADTLPALHWQGNQLRDLDIFIRNLPRPRQRLPSNENARRTVTLGSQLFADIGCAACHTPNLGGVRGIYTDFRLYDFRPYEQRQNKAYKLMSPTEPRPYEWQTPPLWGVADSAPYMHDGRAQTLQEAIQFHLGDGEMSRTAYAQLPPEGQKAIIAFLKTLQAPLESG